MTAPERSLAQRRAALDRANAIRVYRADLKRRIKRGDVGASDVLLEPDDRVLTMPVVDLLLVVPKWGRSKVNRTIVHERISPSKTVGGLSHRQRVALVIALGHRGNAARRAVVDLEAAA